MFVDGTTRTVPAVEPGDRLLDHEGRRPQAAAQPASCRPARERARRHRRHGHRGADRPRQRPQRPVAVRAPARARRRPRAHRDRRRPARGHATRRCASWPSRGWTWSSRAAASARRPTTSRPRSSGASRAARWCSTRRSSERIAEIVEPLMKRWPDLDVEAIRARQPQAGDDPRGRDGARAGRHGARARRRAARRAARARRSSCCPGRRASCSRCGQQAVADRGAARGAARARRPTASGCCGCSGSPSRRSPRRCAWPSARASSSIALEITTCLKRGEIEVVTRYEPDARGRLRRVRARSSRAPRRHAVLRRRQHGRRAGRGEAAGDGRTIATAESCTGGLLAARLTERPGSSDYVQGGDRRLLRTRRRSRWRASPRELIERHGAVSRGGRRGARRRRARRACGADVGVGVTGIAGPGGGTEEKPVGLVWLTRRRAGRGATLTRSVNLPGRARATCATARRPSRCTCCAARCGVQALAPGRARSESRLACFRARFAAVRVTRAVFGRACVEVAAGARVATMQIERRARCAPTAPAASRLRESCGRDAAASARRDGAAAAPARSRRVAVVRTARLSLRASLPRRQTSAARAARARARDVGGRLGAAFAASAGLRSRMRAPGVSRRSPQPAASAGRAVGARRRLLRGARRGRATTVRLALEPSSCSIVLRVGAVALALGMRDAPARVAPRRMRARASGWRGAGGASKRHARVASQATARAATSSAARREQQRRRRRARTARAWGEAGGQGSARCIWRVRWPFIVALDGRGERP